LKKIIKICFSVFFDSIQKASWKCACLFSAL
jgi:hypothetical protein